MHACRKRTPVHAERSILLVLSLIRVVRPHVVVIILLLAPHWSLLLLLLIILSPLHSCPLWPICIEISLLAPIVLLLLIVVQIYLLRGRYPVPLIRIVLIPLILLQLLLLRLLIIVVILTPRRPGGVRSRLPEI